MNNIATAVLAVVLAAGAAFGAWRAGVLGPQYATVLRATPVTVREPHYVDVLQVVPVEGTRAPGYVVSYRVGGRIERVHLARDPGDQLRVGERSRVIGYDVAWRWRDRSGVARMGKHPGRRLPVVDGAVTEARRPAFPARPG